MYLTLAFNTLDAGVSYIQRSKPYTHTSHKTRRVGFHKNICTTWYVIKITSCYDHYTEWWYLLSRIGKQTGISVSFYTHCCHLHKFRLRTISLRVIQWYGISILTASKHVENHKHNTEHNKMIQWVAIQYNTMQNKIIVITIQYNTTRYEMIRLLQYTVQYNTKQNNTIQTNTSRFSTVHYRTSQCIFIHGVNKKNYYMAEA